MSDDLESRVTALEATARDHETRLEKLEGTYTPPTPIPQPPPEPTGKSKLGIHITTMAGAPSPYDAATFIQAKPSCIKFAGEWGVSADPHLVDTFIVGRKICDEDAQYFRQRWPDPTVAANQLVHGKFAQYETCYRFNPAIKHWEGHNEPVWTDDAGMSWYAQFEIARMKLMDSLGLKCVIGNFSTGVPYIESNRSPNWKPFLPACEYALQHGHVLGVHEYTGAWMWWLTGDFGGMYTSDGRVAGYLTLRYRATYERFLVPAGLGKLPLVITECGLDPAIDDLPDTNPPCPGGAWRNLAGWWAKTTGERRPSGVAAFTSAPQFYAEQLKWYDRELRRDNFVIGATIFNAGNNWPAWDICGKDGCINTLSDYVQSRGE